MNIDDDLATTICYEIRRTACPRFGQYAARRATLPCHQGFSVSSAMSLPKWVGALISAKSTSVLASATLFDLDRIAPLVLGSRGKNRVDIDSVRTGKSWIRFISDDHAVRSAFVAFISQIVVRERRKSRSIRGGDPAVFWLLDNSDRTARENSCACCAACVLGAGGGPFLSKVAGGDHGCRGAVTPPKTRWRLRRGKGV
jgi:hypothetical protein